MATLMQKLARLWRHRWSEGQVHRTFPPEVLLRLERAVTASESLHTGQIRLCVEGGLPYSYIWRGASARERAVALFGKLRTWDTEHNNGVLVYLLMADHAIEIVADRGLARQVPQAHWDGVLAHMQQAFRQRQFEAGLTEAIDRVDEMLRLHFPLAPGQRNPNELPDLPQRG